MTSGQVADSCPQFSPFDRVREDRGLCSLRVDENGLDGVASCRRPAKRRVSTAHGPRGLPTPAMLRHLRLSRHARPRGSWRYCSPLDLRNYARCSLVARQRCRRISPTESPSMSEWIAYDTCSIRQVDGDLDLRSAVQRSIVGEGWRAA